MERTPSSRAASIVDVIPGGTSHRVAARGIDFHFLEWGAPDAPPMVLLHGLTGHARTWDHMAVELARQYHCYVPDQRGHGDTSHAGSYDTADFVADLEALRAQWDLERFVLVGLSMGGHNAMAYAAQFPERVSRLIVIDIPPRFDRAKTPGWDNLLRLAEDGHKTYPGFAAAFADARAANQTAPDENLRYRTALNLVDVPDGVRLKYDPRCPARWAPADLSDALGAITAPVLLVRGALTTVLPRDRAEAMTAALPDAELMEIAGSGHSVPTDAPEKLTPVILEWLSRRAAG